MTVGWSILIAATFVAADTAGDVAPQVTQTLSVLQADFFFPLAVGAGVFLLANGLAILRTGALQSWLGWVAVVLGVVGNQPGRVLRDRADARVDTRGERGAVPEQRPRATVGGAAGTGSALDD